ncbi:hypothetical protein FSARC_2164 [Fusarium sarcochroum]|uniref:Uncharacterized protein n=1 Tax=Fusarium sarcochroum TaxID=1208366 RepID=A0A8H4XE78_9HYPO|nr:hypothetical protein FSARC_2164 [Fusarium sarcochroum]
MSQYREIKIVMSSRPCTTSTITTKNKRKAAWQGCLFRPIKTWATALFGKKSTYTELDEDYEPLLEEKMAPRPTYAASTFMRRAASRTIRKYNRLSQG